MEEVAAKIFELRAALVRAGASGSLIFGISWDDVQAIGLKSDWPSPLRQNLERSDMTISGCPVIFQDVLLEALELLKEKNQKKQDFGVTT